MSKKKNDAKFTRYVQDLLIQHGYDIEKTGVNDKATQAAFQAFQKQRGFRATGTATPETLASLQMKKTAGVATAPLPRERPKPQALTGDALTGAGSGMETVDEKNLFLTPDLKPTPSDVRHEFTAGVWGRMVDDDIRIGGARRPLANPPHPQPDISTANSPLAASTLPRVGIPRNFYKGPAEPFKDWKAEESRPTMNLPPALQYLIDKTSL